MGPGCGKCWHLINGKTSITVLATDRCGGRCYGKPFICDKEAAPAATCDCATCIEGKKEYRNDTTVSNPTCPCSAVEAMFSAILCLLFSWQCSCLSAQAKRSEGLCAPGILCDWCAHDDHPHFDLDMDAFNAICGPQSGQGSCNLTTAVEVRCDGTGPGTQSWSN